MQLSQVLLCQVRTSPLTVPGYCIHMRGLGSFWDTTEPEVTTVFLLLEAERYTSLRGTFVDCRVAIIISLSGFICFGFGDILPRVASLFEAAVPLISGLLAPLFLVWFVYPRAPRTALSSLLPLATFLSFVCSAFVLVGLGAWAGDSCRPALSGKRWDKALISPSSKVSSASPVLISKS